MFLRTISSFLAVRPSILDLILADPSSKAAVFSSWLRGRYQATVTHLLTALRDTAVPLAIQHASLCALMDLVRRPSPSEGSPFDNQLFVSIIETLVCAPLS